MKIQVGLIKDKPLSVDTEQDLEIAKKKWNTMSKVKIAIQGELEPIYTSLVMNCSKMQN